MGTSDRYEGSQSPPDSNMADEPASPPSVNPGGGQGSSGNEANEGQEGALPPKPDPSKPLESKKSQLSKARGLMTEAVRTSDPGKIKCGAAHYVKACGGGPEAAHGMPNSRAVAVRIAGLARSIQNQGSEQALRHFHLEDMVGMPAEDVFGDLIDMICPDGGTLDEAVARQAMAHATGDLAEAQVGSFENLSTNDFRDFSMSYVARSIEIKIYNETATNAVGASFDVEGVASFEKSLYDFVDGCVKDEFDAQKIDFARIEQKETNRFVENLYANILDTIEERGENQ